jgi:hypothetical protein
MAADTDVRSWVNNEWDSFLNGGRPKSVTPSLEPARTARTSRWGQSKSAATRNTSPSASISPVVLAACPPYPIKPNEIYLDLPNKYLELPLEEVEIANQYARALLGTVRGQFVSHNEPVADWSPLRCFAVPNKPSQWPWLFEHHIVRKEGYNIYMAPHILLAHELLRARAGSGSAEAKVEAAGRVAPAFVSNVPSSDNGPDISNKPIPRDIFLATCERAPASNLDAKVHAEVKRTDLDPLPVLLVPNNNKNTELCIRCRVSTGEISIAPNKQICMDCARPSELRSVLSVVHPSAPLKDEYDPSDPSI